MKLLALTKVAPGATQEIIQANLEAEAWRGWELYKAGIFREMYTRKDRPGAVLVLECDSVEAAREVVDTLPLVQAGQLEIELIPLGYFQSFERLIETDA